VTRSVSKQIQSTGLDDGSMPHFITHGDSCSKFRPAADMFWSNIAIAHFGISRNNLFPQKAPATIRRPPAINHLGSGGDEPLSDPSRRICSTRIAICISPRPMTRGKYSEHQPCLPAKSDVRSCFLDQTSGCASGARVASMAGQRTVMTANHMNRGRIDRHEAGVGDHAVRDRFDDK